MSRESDCDHPANENGDLANNESPNEKPAFRVISVVEGTDRPKVLERVWTSQLPVVTEQSVYEYSETDQRLVSMTLRRKFDDGDWEDVEFNLYDDQGRVIQRMEAARSTITTYEYLGSPVVENRFWRRGLTMIRCLLASCVSLILCVMANPKTAK